MEKGGAGTERVQKKKGREDGVVVNMVQGQGEKTDRDEERRQENSVSRNIWHITSHLGSRIYRFLSMQCRNTHGLCRSNRSENSNLKRKNNAYEVQSISLTTLLNVRALLPMFELYPYERRMRRRPSCPT